MRVVKIIVLDDVWVGRIREWFPTTEVQRYSLDMDEGSLPGLVDCAFSDIAPPSKLRIWLHVSRYILVTRSVRRVTALLDGWNHSHVRLCHVDCGGVTDGSWDINVYWYKTVRPWDTASMHGISARDLSSVVKTTVPHGLPCREPAQAVGDPPRLLEIRPNTYHGGGLFPFKERNSYFVVPSVFSPTRWCRRHFTGEETLRALDVPATIIADLSSKEIAALCNDTKFVPLGVSLRVAHSLEDMDTIPSPAVWSSQGGVAVGQGAQLSDLMLLERAAPDDWETKPLALGAEQRKLEATKADDAEIPRHLWDDRLIAGVLTTPLGRRELCLHLDTLRGFLIQIWRKRLRREFVCWFKAEYPSVNMQVEMREVQWSSSMYQWASGALRPCASQRNLRGNPLRDYLAGVDCVSRGCDADWWEWVRGSRPMFWRWPPEYRSAIRDGLPLWLKGKVARWRVPQQPERDPNVRENMRHKLALVRYKGYICKGKVESLTSFFAVPKGPDDIRMVYDGTKSGLNSTLWAPWFPLPTVEHHLRAVEPGSYMGDLDVGEMFLNFILHERIQVYCGVDLTTYFPEELKDVDSPSVLWEKWGRCGMGFTSSPYQAIQGMLYAEEMILGDPLNPENAYRWDIVKLNLPGSDDYDPALPWVCKIRLSDGRIACDIFIYVDDVRVIGSNDNECWEASHQAASKLNWLGLQDAARKRRAPSTEPGAWAGSIIHSEGGIVVVMVSQDRWDKTKTFIAWIADQLDQEEGLDFKMLERVRGYLVYISRTYPSLVPYLKGVHLTLDAWRPWRKEDGWKMSLKEIRAAMDMEAGIEEWSNASELPERRSTAPARVKAVPRLKEDVRALQELTSESTPPKRPVRPKASAVALYGFADASGKGFGSSLAIGGTLHFRHGQWAAPYEDESSNFRELANLVLAIEEASRDGLLNDAELFMFTDNSTAEAAFYKGTSSSRPLFELVLRLRRLQMNGEISIHVIHVAGTRMIAEGTDGLSRGSLAEGVMRGQSMLKYIPLDKNAVERGPQLRAWLGSWYGGGEITWLDPSGWFKEGQSNNRCIWVPPPAAADVAMELLGKSKHKRPQLEHVVVIPRLMTARWRKQLSKICDIVLTIPVDPGDFGERSSWNEWRACCGICRRLMLNGEGIFCANFANKREGWMACQQAWCGKCYTGKDLFEFPVNEPADEDGFVTLKDSDKDRFLVGRNGDHLMCPFQCDLCHFRNIQGRDPMAAKAEDVRLLRCIRRANLDALWAREPGTVGKNLSEARRGVRIGLALGLKTPFPPMGPYPVQDTFGMSAAVVMLQRSLDVGVHDSTLQFSTARKMRSAFANVYHASALGYTTSMVMAKDTKRLMVTECPTYGAWFERFIQGCHKRMGDIVKPDRAIALDIMHQIMKLIEADWERTREGERFGYAREASFYLIAFCGALRGEEVPMTDIGGVKKHWDAGGLSPTPHVVIALLGRFKNEVGERYHLMPLVARTRSGLEPRKWVGRLLQEYESMGVAHGPLFRDGRGQALQANAFEAEFHRRLGMVQDSRPDLIPEDVVVSEEYGIYRSFRRGATSEATNRGIGPDVIEANNRWRRVERSGNRHAAMPMREHYTDIRLILNQLLRFSEGL